MAQALGEKSGKTALNNRSSQKVEASSISGPSFRLVKMRDIFLAIDGNGSHTPHQLAE
jgi:hypothetical protein